MSETNQNWRTDSTVYAAIITNEEMPGTRANPLPGATSEELARVRAEWVANDPLTQEQRNERARQRGDVVTRGPDGYVIETQES